MNIFTSLEICGVGLLFLTSLVLSIIIILFSVQIGADNPYTEKTSAYECGFDPYEDARNAFDIKFYLIAIIFILFDLETAFFFPWCVSISLVTNSGIWCMVDFLIELTVGFGYAWIIGALDLE